MNDLARELNNLQPTRRVKAVQFGLLDPEVIRRGSVCEITKPDTYDGSEPVINGLFDPRMGVIDRGPKCATCENRSEMCPGHFGHIDLALPVYHMHFVHIVMKLLPCVCFRCSTLLIRKNNKKVLKNLTGKQGEDRFQVIYEASTKSQKSPRCCHNTGCRVIQPAKYTLLTSDKLRGQSKIPGLDKDTVVAIIAEFKEEAIRDISISRKQRIFPQQAYEIFRRITKEDVSFLGFDPVYSRPEWMICTALPVAPPSVRPSVQRENNQRSEDDLTYVLHMIVKANNTLKKKLDKNEDQHKIDAAYNFLQYNTATLISNKIPGFLRNVQRSGKLIKALRERITGKDARLRGNLMGKRVDFSARTVISVDPNISIDEFGMPKKIAMVLSFPDVVTPDNIEELTQSVRNGPNIHPGAKKIERTEYDCYGTPSPCTINLKHVDPNSIRLKIGDIVHRHIKDGDICLFNRQPSLHRMSMMAHKARIVEHNTFRLNVFVCKPYNADFDGDEMNTHIPQSIQTRVELEEIAAVPTQIISPAKSTPIISVVQDSMIGSYLMTRDKLAMTGERLFHYLMPIIQLKSNFNFMEARKKRFWTGNELFSVILPNVSLENSKVTIRNGDIVDGYMDKKTLGGGPNGIIQAIFNQFGSRVCRDFLDNLQRLVIAWMEDTGFTIGFGDAIPSRDTRNKIQEALQSKMLQAEELIRKSQLGMFKPELSDPLRMAALELGILDIANEATSEVEEIVQDNLPEDNHFIESVDSGSKGKAINLNQIMGTIGQQMVDGKRVNFGWNGRTLPHFTKWDNSLSSRGFVYSSYMSGMRPHEFFYAAMGARVGSINSHIRTAETGYIQRRLIKALEDLRVCYDDTVRDAAGNIVQYVYGMDGFDPIKLEHVPLKILSMNNEDMKNEFFWSLETVPENVLTEDAYDRLEKNRKEEAKLMDEEQKQIRDDRDNLRYKLFSKLKELKDKTILSPVNFKRMLQEIVDQFHIDSTDVSDMTPGEVIREVRELVDYTVKYTPNKQSFPILKIMIRTNLSSKQCVNKLRLPRSVFLHIMQTIRHKILYSYVNPGEMVGVVAAQSIGEPVTQLTLNTFHFAGVGAKAMITNSGVPRVQEIINMSKDIKTPSMLIYLKPEYSLNREAAMEVKNALEYTEIQDILEHSEILYVPNVKKGKYPEEEQQYEAYEEMLDLMDMECDDPSTLSNWVLWMEFDREAMLQRGIYMQDVHEEIIKNCNVDTEIQCVVPDMNSGNLTLRIRVRQDFEEGEDYIAFFRSLGDCLLTLPLRGVLGIKKAFPETGCRIRYKSDGSPEIVKEWVIRTEGSNMIEVLSNDYVDPIRTSSNDISEIFQLFGIEGARYAIIRELETTIAAGGASEVDYRHFAILADLMTYRGKVMQIQRHGFGKSPYIGPLGRATYEVMDKVLITAGIFAETDNMNGTSANIIAGQAVKTGTNAFDLLMNQHLLPEPEDRSANQLLPPEPKVSDLPEMHHSPAMAPLENMEAFEFDDDFAEKMAASNATKEVRLEDYLRDIGSHPIQVDDGDFTFGYDIDNLEERSLPPAEFDGKIQLNIVKSTQVNVNRRRRKK